MVNFVEQPEERFRELEPQVNGFVNQLANMRTEYRNWIATYNRNVNESVEILHPKIDYAFEQLNELTKKLLNCTDEQINAPDDALPTNEPKRQLLDALNTIRSAFHSLSETAAAGLEKAGKYTQEAFVKEHNFFNFKESVTNLEGTLQSERLQCESTCCSYDREFSSAQNELRGIENRLSDYDNLSGFEQFFVSNPHDGWDGRRDDQRKLCSQWEYKLHLQATFRGQIQNLCRTLMQLRTDTEQLFAANVEDEHSMIDTKKIAADVYNKLYDMEVQVLSTEVKISIEDALRHVLKLTYISVDMVDQDEHVKVFKGLILGSIADKYGREKTEELKQDRQLLADPLDD